MDLPESIAHRLEVREYADEPVDEEVVRAVAEAARLAPSSKNRQDWQFLVVEDRLDELAAASPTGGWIADAAFAVVVLTGDYPSHGVDVGRAVTHMQFAAWEHGIGSCIYTGVDEDAQIEAFDIPEEMVVGAVVGFGYPAGSGTGHKDRRAFADVVSRDRFGGEW